MAEIALKRLTAADTAVLGNVAAEVFDEPIDAERSIRYLAEPGHLMVIALDGDLVVAQCAAVIHRHPDKKTELYIDEVGVAVGYRRRGIARRMLDAMFALGRDAGCEEAWVGTEDTNVAARALYETRGGTTAEPFVMYLYTL